MGLKRHSCSDGYSKDSLWLLSGPGDLSGPDYLPVPREQVRSQEAEQACAPLPTTWLWQNGNSSLQKPANGSNVTKAGDVV